MECHLLCLHLFISLIKFINVYRIYHLNNVDISLYIKNWPSIYFQAYLTSNTDGISDITKAIFHLKWSASIEYISLGVFPCVKQSTIYIVAYKRGIYEIFGPSSVTEYFHLNVLTSEMSLSEVNVKYITRFKVNFSENWRWSNAWTIILSLYLEDSDNMFWI